MATHVVTESHVVPQTHVVTHDMTTVHEVATHHTAYHDVITGYHQVPVSTGYSSSTTTTPTYSGDGDGSDSSNGGTASYNTDGTTSDKFDADAHRRLADQEYGKNAAKSTYHEPVAVYHPPVATSETHYHAEAADVGYHMPVATHSHAYSQSYAAVVTYRPQSVVYTMTQHLVCSPRVHVEYSCPACHNGKTYALHHHMDDYGAWLTPKEAESYHYKTHVYKHVYHGGKRGENLLLASQTEEASVTKAGSHAPVLLMSAVVGTLIILSAMFVVSRRKLQAKTASSEQMCVKSCQI
jgi:hypothetical protein